MRIDVVYCRDNGGKIRGRAPREEGSRVLENLHERRAECGCEFVVVYQAVKFVLRTLNTLRSCDAISHSSGESSKLCRPLLLSLVNISTACRYLTATSSMSYVEFQCVFTSRGSNFSRSFNVLRTAFHAGRSFVVEWMILKASLRN